MTIERIRKDVKDDSGREVKLVSLGKTGNVATIYKSDYEFLLELGLSAEWVSLSRANHVQAYCPDLTGKPSHVTVARVLLDAGNGEIVRYKDRNPMNLRSCNIYKVDNAKGKRRDRMFVVKSRKNKDIDKMQLASMVSLV